MAFVDITGESVIILEQPDASLQVTSTERAPQVIRQFPFGLYFDRSAGWLPQVSKAIARFLSRLDRRQLAFERNFDPRQADELLDEWETAFAVAVDPNATVDDRRDAILAKVRARGGVTAAYYEALATDFGYGDAVVTDAADPFTTVSLADDFLAGGEWKVTFLLTAASQGATRDQLLQDLINSQLLAGWFAIYDFT